MNLMTLIYYLRKHALPWTTKAKRKASVAAFQAAFAFYNITIDGIPGRQTLAAFRHAAKHGHRIAPHFRIREFRCGCGGRYHDAAESHVHRDLVRALEKTRSSLYPTGLSIVSGWRCTRFNKNVGGIADSEHLKGRAADIPAKHTPDRFRRLGFHGIGYKAAHGRVTHVDIDAGMKPDTIFRES